ncbi:MAG: hypothetical protein V7L22_33510 [Nostoc sp.]
MNSVQVGDSLRSASILTPTGKQATLLVLVAAEFLDLDGCDR